jgi:hypothetical protein
VQQRARSSPPGVFITVFRPKAEAEEWPLRSLLKTKAPHPRTLGNVARSRRWATDSDLRTEAIVSAQHHSTSENLIGALGLAQQVERG